MPLKETPLHQMHKELKANMVPFAGYHMPVYYTSIKEEYYQTRQNTGIFDISHMTPLVLSSQNPSSIKDMIGYLTPRDLAEMTPGRIYYNVFLNEEGGIKDDVTLYFINENKMMIIANAINGEKIFSWLNHWVKQQYNGIKVEIPENYVFLAIQGKTSETVIQKCFQETSLEYKDLDYYAFSMIDNDYSFFSRTGYTGEDGFEILLPSDQGKKLWNASLENGAKPAGLGSRDILRMEMFYPLYGHELKEDLTPLESGLAFITSKEKDYLAKEIIWNKSPSKKLIKFTLKEKGIPREKMAILRQDDKIIGYVTSGGFSFQWNCGFGMGLIDSDEDIDNLKIAIRDKNIPIEVHKKRPYSGSIKKS